MKKVLKYLLVFIACWAWALPLKAQLLADYSHNKYQGNFKLADSVKMILDKEGMTKIGNVRTLGLQFKGNNSVFQGSFKAKYTKFDNVATFASSVFQSDADFSNAEFHSNVDFSSTEFQKEVIFEETKFYNKVDFTGTDFKQVPHFVNTVFSVSVSFDGVKVPNKLLFVGVNVHDYNSAVIDLGGIDTGGKLCYIDLRNTNVRKVMLDYSKFQIYFDARYRASNGNDTTDIKKMYEDLIFQQKTYDFQEGYQKAVKEYKAWKQNMRAQIKAGTWRGVFNDKPINSAIWWMVAVMMLMILFVAVLLPMRINSLLTKLTTAQDTTKPVMVPAQEIVQNVERGTELWQDYEADHASENEHFWTQYERLIGKAKSQK